MTMKKNTTEWWIRRIKDPTIRNFYLGDSTYQSMLAEPAQTLQFALSWDHSDYETTNKHYNAAKLHKIELLDEPVSDIPEWYYVKNPWPNEVKSDFVDLIHSLSEDWNGDSPYYKFYGTSIEDAYTKPPNGTPKVSYEVWRAYVMQETGKSIPVSVLEDGKYKVGHWVHINIDRKWAKKGDVAQITGFDGVHWYIQGLRGEKGCFYFTENSPIVRSATPEEIAQAASPSYKADDWVVVTRERGIKITTGCPFDEQDTMKPKKLPALEGMVKMVEIQNKYNKVDQELEDAAKKYSTTHKDVSDKLGQYLVGACFKDGADWQKQQTANDAIEFARWLSKECTVSTNGIQWWYTKSSSYKKVTELYELWQLNRIK